MEKGLSHTLAYLMAFVVAAVVLTVIASILQSQENNLLSFIGNQTELNFEIG